MCIKKTIWILLTSAVLTSCSSIQGRYSYLGEKHPARAVNSKVRIFKSETPQRNYTKVSRIDVHMVKTFYIKPDLNDVLPEIKRQANLSGADAVIDIQDRTSGYGEYKEYHVTATGIKFIQ